MKHHTRFFITALGLSLALMSNCVIASAKAHSVKKATGLQISNPDKAIQVTQKKPEFTITLKSNATTGYRWFIQSLNQKLLEIKNSEYIAPDSNMMGAPGYQTWSFKVKSNGFKAPRVLKIKFVYARPWEPKAAETLSFTIYTANLSSKSVK